MIRKRLLQLLPWLAAALLLALVLRSVSLGQVWSALHHLESGELVILLLVNGMVLLTLNGRWWLILRGQGYDLPFLTLLAHRLAAFGISYFTPGPHFGGEPVQVLLVEQSHGVPRTTAVAAVSLDKTLELLVNFTFLTLGVLVVLQSQLLGMLVGWEAAVLAGSLLLLPLLLLGLMWRGKRPFSALLAGAEWLWPRLGGPAWRRLRRGVRESERQMTAFCRKRPWVLGQAFIVSVLSWLALLAEYWLLLRFLGVVLTPLQVVAMLTAARIAILLPLPGGLGTLEASQVLMLSLLGFPAAAGISVTLVIRMRDVLLGSLGLWWGSRHWRLRTTRP